MPRSRRTASSRASSSRTRSSLSLGVARSVDLPTLDSRTPSTTSQSRRRRERSRPATRQSSVTRPTTSTDRQSRAASVIGGELQDIICALSEARGIPPSVGVCSINLTTGEVILSQICDNQFYVKTVHKMQVLEPSKILIVSSSCPPNPKSSLYSMIEEHVLGSSVVSLDRRLWSETVGLEYIQNLASKEDSEAIKVAIEGNFYATCSFAAAMRYLETEQAIYIVPHSLRIRYQPSEDTMMIDLSAIQSLELIRNQRDTKSKNSLFGVLNHTLTSMGSRLLRSNILQPTTLNDTVLIPRYDALQELSSDEDVFRDIRKNLKNFPDIEKLLVKLIFVSTKPSVHESEQAINHVLMIKSFLESATDIYHALEPAKSDLLSKIKNLCHPDIIKPILELVTDTIRPEVTYVKSPLDLRNQRTFAVKSGTNELLDVARQTYQEGNEDVHAHVEYLNKTFSLDAVLKYDNGRKFWLRLKAADFETRTLPEDIINRVNRGRNIECQTLKMVKLNQRITDSATEVILQSDKTIQDLLDKIRLQAPHLFRVCESVALLDMITSFAQLTTIRDFVRPEITGTLALKAARHPLLDLTMAGKFVPNDYYATDEYRFQIITGCNMSGKSTYIRSIAMLQIMAQIGCFIPAEYAAFPIVRNIFARVSTDDSIEANMSTFSMEMREMAFILRNIDSQSIAIIDELGRGTSTRDGLAIALAMAEALIRSGATVWFATHFLEISTILADHPGVLNLHLATKTCPVSSSNVPQMTMLYKVTSGVVKEDNYGIALAQAVGFPHEMIRFAERVVGDLKAKREANQETSESAKLIARRKLVLTLHETLKQVVASKMDSGPLVNYLRRLQEDFILAMEAIDQKGQDKRGEGGRGPADPNGLGDTDEVDKADEGSQEESDVEMSSSPG